MDNGSTRRPGHVQTTKREVIMGQYIVNDQTPLKSILRYVKLTEYLKCKILMQYH